MFNVVQGIGEEAGAALVAHPRRAARVVHRLAGDGRGYRPSRPRATSSRSPAELGGKGPLLVFADADLDAAAAKAAGQYDDAGQVCLAGTRILVEESVTDAFLERLLARHRRATCSATRATTPPRSRRSSTASTCDRVEGFVERARGHGDRIVRGGHVGRARRASGTSPR